MKIFSATFLFGAVFLTSVFAVNAQAAETIWIQTNSTAYKTNETVTVNINAISAIPIQGFNAQLRYDPSCLEPVNGTSPIPGMNGLALPQTSGLVDASFASTTPLQANGVVAEVRFTALKGCATGISLETASLVIRNESGFAAPVSGVQIDQNAIALNIDSAVGIPQPEDSGASLLPLAPTIFPESKAFNLQVVLWLALAGALVILILGLYKLMGPARQSSTVRR